MQPANALRTLLVSMAMIGALLIPGVKGYADNTDVTAIRSDYQSGVQAYRIGDYIKAIGYFQHSLTSNSSNTNAHYYLGLSFDNLDMATQAIPEYQYVISHGQEDKIVAYAKTRLLALNPEAKLSHTSASQNVAMVAAGSQLPSTAYKGTAAQFSVPLKSNRNALMVDAVLEHDKNQAIGTFIIDTGATYTSISQEMAEQMGLDLENCDKVYITTANGRIEVPKVVIDKLNVNGLEAHNVEATVIQVRHGSSFSGLLGLSFIRQFVLPIDPQAGQLIFQKN